MPIKNNDDVAHLLEATGRSGSPYREFEAPSDHMSAPLIDAVFAKGPPEPAFEGHRPAPLQAGPAGGDLLSEVFEGAPRSAPPATSHQAPSFPPPAGFPKPAPQPAAVGLSTAYRRSLNDIRRIIMKPAEDVPSAQPTGGLNGLFDRLAG